MKRPEIMFGASGTIEYIDLLEQKIEAYETMFRKTLGEVPDGYFICGGSVDKDEHGLPEYITVCPASGLDFSMIYKRHSS